MQAVFVNISLFLNLSFHFDTALENNQQLSFTENFYALDQLADYDIIKHIEFKFFTLQSLHCGINFALRIS